MLLPIHIYFYPYLVSIKIDYVRKAVFGSTRNRLFAGPFKECLIEKKYHLPILTIFGS